MFVLMSNFTYNKDVSRLCDCSGWNWADRYNGQERAAFERGYRAAVQDVLVLAPPLEANGVGRGATEAFAKKHRLVLGLLVRPS